HSRTGSADRQGIGPQAPGDRRLLPPRPQTLGRGLLLSIPDGDLPRFARGTDSRETNQRRARVGAEPAAASNASSHDAASRRNAMRLVILAVLALALAGCGYSQSGGENNKQQSGYHWNSLYREDIQTVAVPVFSTKDYRRGIEFRLTEAVIKQLELHAPY